MALQKVVRNMLSTGVSDSSDATAITIDSSERVGIGMSPNSGSLNYAMDIQATTAGNALRIKGISATAVGDLLIGQASNAGYTRLVKPSGNATAHDYILSMNTSGAAQWSNTLDGGTF